ncbi:MAG: RidA family protein, partial [Rhodobiaceae bacterium]|nr:RidA family protein [Rhodobiaceae bacterium]
MSVTRIEKTTGPGPIMSRCVIKGDMVFVAGLTATDRSADITGQTQQILDKIDGFLAQAGTDKSKLLQANLWITDMSNFAAMNAVWNSWVDPENPPVRACVRADLAVPELLVEIMVTAYK